MFSRKPGFSGVLKLANVYIIWHYNSYLSNVYFSIAYANFNSMLNLGSKCIAYAKFSALNVPSWKLIVGS